LAKCLDKDYMLPSKVCLWNLRLLKFLRLSLRLLLILSKEI